MARHRSRLLTGTALQPGGPVAGWLLGAGLAMALAGPAAADPLSNARPQGGVVSAGVASISQAPTNTQINQSSTRAVIDWQGFDVGSKQSVTIQQPSSSAVLLNRVNAANPSQIAGHISANGEVVIENRSGVIFSNGAQVDAQSLVVTAAGISNASFMAGGTTFAIPANPNARIVNGGHITVGQAGLAALVAPNVVNAGTITARFGRVVLAGAATATVDLYGDGLLSLDVGSAVRQIPVGPDGKPVTALVTNSGAVIAQGGTVQLSARAADGLVVDLVRAGGHIATDNPGGQGGTIKVVGIGGDVVVQGTLSATGGTGGQVAVNATRAATVASGAAIDVSGQSAGGTVAIGTTLARARGGISVKSRLTAQRSTVQAGATITANATGTGNGGTVTVLSSQQTSMAGHISAEGGPYGGHGGSVEVSGEAGLSLTGTIDVGAAQGAAGSILLDPQDLTIQSGGTDGTLLASGTIGADDNGASLTAISATIDPAVFANLTGTVVLQAARDLTVSSPFTASAADLSLQAGRNLTVNAPIALTGAGTITLAAAVGGFAAAPGYDAAGPAGTVHITNTGGVSATLGTVALSGGTGGVILDGPVSARGLTVNTTGPFNATGIITAGTLSGQAASANLSGANRITRLGDFVAAGDFILNNATGLTVSGVIEAGGLPAPGDGNTNTISLTAAGDLTIVTSGTLAGLTAGTVALLASGTITDAGGIIAADLVRGPALGQAITSAAAVTLTGVNFVAASGPFTSSGNFSLRDAEGLLVAGTISAGTTGRLDLQTGGTLAIGTAGTASLLQAGTVTLFASRAISEPNGGISASLLTGSAAASSSASNISGGGVALTGANTIATLGSLRTPSSFALTDTGALTVTGTVGNTSSLSSLALSAPGGIAIGLVAQPGTLNAGTLSLGSAGTISEPNGVINTATLSGVAARFDLGAGNAVSALGSVTAAGALTFNDASPLTLTDLVTAGGVLSLTVHGSLAQTTGSLNGPTLTGHAGSVSLAGTNSIPVLGDFASSSGLTLATTGALAIGGTVSAGGTLSLTAGGALRETTGVLSAPAFIGHATTIALTGANTVPILAGATATSSIAFTTSGALALAGPVVAAGTVALTAGGALTETGGSISAGMLTGAATSASLTAANTVATLGAFTSAAGLALNDTGNLVLAGTVTAGGTVALMATGAISEAGGVLLASALTGNAASVTLAAANTVPVLAGYTTSGDLTLDTTGHLAVTAPVSVGGTLALVAGGAITQPGGPITAASLSGSAASATLTAANTITTIAGFSTTGGLALTDTGSLTIAGVVTSSAATLNVGGDLSLGAAGALSTGALAITVGGNVVAASGGITATQLTGSAVSLDISGGNSIASLGGFVVTGDFTLNDQVGLTIGGTLASGGNVTLASSGAISQTQGLISAPTLTASGTSVFLAAGNSIAALGGLTTSGNATLINATGLVLGNTSVGGTLALGLSGDLTQSGTIAAASLTGSAGKVTLTGSGNAIGSIGTFTATGPFSLASSALAVTGPLNAPSVSFTSGGSILVSGGITTTGQLSLQAGGPIQEIAGAQIQAATLVGSASTLQLAIGAGNSIGTLGGFTTSSGGLTLADGASLALAGPISAAGGVTLSSPAAITQSSGTLQSGGGDILVAGSSFQQAGAAVITAPGTVTIGTSGSIALSGLVTGADVILASGSGAISAGSATLTATHLTLAAPLGASLGAPANSIGTLDAAAVASLVLTDAGSLHLAGPVLVTNGVSIVASGDIRQAAGASVTAASIALQSPGTIVVEGSLQAAQILLAGQGTGAASSIVFGNGAALATGSAGTLSGLSTLAQLPTGGNGAFLRATNLTQSGGLAVTGLAQSGSPTLRLDVAGTASFDPTAGLAAPSANLILNLLPGAVATGNIIVQGLYAAIPATGGGKAALTGSIAGITGATAAQSAHAVPQTNASYTLNGCTIGIASCPVTNTQSSTGTTSLGSSDQPAVASVTFIAPQSFEINPAAGIGTLTGLGDTTPASEATTIAGVTGGDTTTTAAASPATSSPATTLRLFQPNPILDFTVREVRDDRDDTEIQLPNISDRDY